MSQHNDKSVKPGLLEKEILKEACKGSLARVRALAAAGANLNACDVWGNTPLIIAAAGCWTDIVCFLATKGADVGVRNDCDRSALYYCFYRKKTDAAAALISAGAKLVDNEAMLLCEAVIHKEPTEFIKLLLDAGAKPNAKFGTFSPFWLAASEGYTEAVRIMLDYGADVNQKDSRGYSAFDIADEKIREVMVQYCRYKNIIKQGGRK